MPHLVATGWRVRAAARSRRVLEARDWQGVELVEADALRGDTLQTALEGVDVAFYLVHSMAAGGNFGWLDLQAADNFARSAAAAGVRRIVYLGGLVPGGSAGEHIDSRRETGDRLRSGPVPVTEIRAGIIIGPGSAAFEVMRDLVMHLPVMVTPRWVRAKSPPIALSNLLVYLEQVARLPAAAGWIYDAGGPELCSYEDMMREMALALGKRPPLILPVPVLSPGLSSYWLGLVTSVPASIARALIGGLRHDFEARDEPLRALVTQQLLSMQEAIEAAFSVERERRVAARWTEGDFAIRGFRHDVAYYAKRACGSAVARVPAHGIWQEVTGIGGHNGYYFMNALWWLRGFMDWCVGGPGLIRGRRHPQELRLGDAVDSWSVIGMEPERRLTLLFGMKAPGSGVLEFEIESEEPGMSRITATAYWHPQGIWGLAYWYALAPAHRVIFRGLSAAIARRAVKKNR